MSLRTFAATALMTAALSGLPPARVAAQGGAKTPPPAPAEPPVVETRSAEETRALFQETLRNYPPALGQVLRLDPALLTSPDYLAPYPALTSFLAQHPSIVHNPTFYLGPPQLDRFEASARHQTINQLEEIGVGIGIFLFFMTALGVATHIGRALLEHRRWLHATKIQTEAHTKLFDRLASNDELLAYAQSPAGQRFLAAAPMLPDAESRLGTSNAPIGRILTSVQIGIVGACGGLGLWVAKSQVIEEVAQPLYVIAILALALGLGFVISALVSYSLSRQLGLIKDPSAHA